MGIVISLKRPLTCQEAIPLPGFSMATDKSLFLPDEQAEKFKAGPALCPPVLALGMPLPPPWSWHPITRVRDSLQAPLPAWPPSPSLRPRVHSRHINLVTPTADRPARRPRAVRGPTWPRMRGTDKALCPWAGIQDPPRDPASCSPSTFPLIFHAIPVFQPTDVTGQTCSLDLSLPICTRIESDESGRSEALPSPRCALFPLISFTLRSSGIEVPPGSAPLG